MRVCTIASGSSGNCIYAGTESTHLLIDAGISARRIGQGLDEAGLSLKDIDAILVTHEHSDHVKGLGVLARKLGKPVYATEKSRQAVLADKRLGTFPDGLFAQIRADEDFEIGDIRIHAFSTSHDAADPVGFRLESGQKSFAVATDLGYYNDYIVRQLQKLDVLLIESNHDVHMLEAGSYPYYLKQRILSDKGHLSNESAGRLLNEILHDDMRQIILGHLSRENNYPALAYETVCSEITFGECPYKAGDFKIEIAGRDEPGTLIEW